MNIFSTENEAWQNESRKARKEQVCNIHFVSHFRCQHFFLCSEKVGNKVVQFYFITWRTTRQSRTIFKMPDSYSSSSRSEIWFDILCTFTTRSKWHHHQSPKSKCNPSINKFLDNQTETNPSTCSQFLCYLLINCTPIHNWIISQIREKHSHMQPFETRVKVGKISNCLRERKSHIHLCSSSSWQEK